MLKSLYINNYRCLEKFTIQSLERVNLITGKNNTGKSSMLEALVLYASKGSIAELRQILEEHGEYRLSSRKVEDEIDLLEALISIFHNRKIDFYNNNSIKIGEIDKQKSLFGDKDYKLFLDSSIVLQFVKYEDEIKKDSSDQITRKRRLLSKKEEDKEEGDLKNGLSIIVDGKVNIFIPIETDYFRRYSFVKRSPLNNYQFIKTSNIDKEDNGVLFDKIALSDKEEYVVEALQIIEPKTERIAFVDSGFSNNNYRTPVIKLRDSREIVPLRSMGDGINRILTIILALINSEDGYLMIDEIENGLHYSVQEALWEIIFDLSNKLNVQVFATTHSEDSISSFQRVLNNNPDDKSGKLIRLENINGTIKEVQYTAEELRIANDHNIEVR